MKRITFYLVAFFLVAFSWQGMAQYFTEGFENAGAFPTGWTLTNGTDDWGIDQGDDHGPGAAQEGTYSAFFNDYDYTSGTVSEMITPSIDLSASTNPELSFWYQDSGGSDTVEVSVSTDGTSYTPLFTTNSSVSDWTRITVSLAAYQGGATVTISFKGTSVYGTTNPHIDNVMVGETPEYVPVYTLADLRAGTVGEKYEFKGEGFATMARLSASGNGSIRVWGQDATAGMQFYAASGVISATSINFGDGVTDVQGTLTEAYGNLVFVVDADVTLTGNNEPVIPQVVTAQDYVDNREDYESELIKINKATIDSNGNSVFVQYSQYAITDASGGDVTLGVIFPQLNGTIPAMANVTGLAGENNGVASIAPRGDTDVVEFIPPVNDTMAGAIPIVPSPEGTVCDSSSEFTAHTAGDGTSDSGMDGTCNGANTGLDRFYSWTATSDALVWSGNAGGPGVVIRDAAGTEITCEQTLQTDSELSGWTLGDNLIIQVYDFSTDDVDVTFCLAKKMLPTCPDPSDLVVSNITETTAEFNLTENGSATAWDFEVVMSGDAPTGTPTEDDVTLPYTAWTGTQNTDYDVYYRSDCGQDNTTDVSNWVGPVSFTTVATPPANDDACNAEMLTLNAAPIVGDNSGSMGQVDEPSPTCWTDSTINSVWYSFVADGIDVTVSTDYDTPLNDTRIAVYSAADCADFTTYTEVGCDDDGGDAGMFGWNSVIDLSGLTDGETYYVQVEGWGTKMDEFNISVVYTPPTNDDICDAIAITVGDTSAGDAYTNLAATAETNEPEGDCFSNGIGGSVWFTFVAPASGAVNVSTDIAGGTNTDTELAVYAAPTDCADATTMGDILGCDQDGGDVVNFNSIAFVHSLVPGDTYYVQVDNWSGTSIGGTFGIEVQEVTVFNPVFETNVVADCANSQYSIDLDVTNLGGSATVTVTDGTTTFATVGTGVVSFGPYAVGTSVDFTVTSDDDVTFTSTETVQYYCPPANDNICDAIALTMDATSASDAYTNLGATGETGEPEGDCFSNGIGGSVWFTFVAPASGTVNVTTNIVGGTNEDTEIAIYEAPTDCADAATMGTLLGCGQDTDANYLSEAVVNSLTPGDTYYVQVDNWSSSFEGGTFGIEVHEILTSAPDCVTLVSPVDGATDVLSPVVLDWDVATGSGDPADSYNLYVSINGGAEFLFNNYTDTETPALGIEPDLTLVWRVVPVNAAGENTTCTTTFTLNSVVGTDDYDGDGVDNMTEFTNGTEMTAPCDPAQAVGYTGYDATNAIWMAADCDGDGMTNGDEDTYGSDPYDPDSNAIDGLETVGFEFYPNPVNNNLTVKANENITSIAIFNMLGQQVKQVNPSSLNAQIDMTNLANGTYFIKATVGEKVGTFKIVKK